jgi:hypothetical protein
VTSHDEISIRALLCSFARWHARTRAPAEAGGNDARPIVTLTITFALTDGAAHTSATELTARQVVRLGQLLDLDAEPSTARPHLLGGARRTLREVRGHAA